jgi:PAN domain
LSIVPDLSWGDALRRWASGVPRQLVGLVATLLVGCGHAVAAEPGQARFGEDYAQFYIGGADWRPCEAECTADASCKSWTYITAQGQCRLKASVVPPRPNNCCVSGVKQERAVAPVKASPDERDCAKWANDALDANNSNISNQCGLTGPLWSRDYAELNVRCLDSSPRRREREAGERKQSLDACQQVSGRTKSLACDHYGRMSVAEAQSNEAGRCGYSGPTWSGSYNDHVRFCQSASAAQIGDQIAGRELQLQECLSRGGGDRDQGCQAYAVQAASQFAQSVRDRCGPAFAGPQWTDDQATHYRWCKAHGPAERNTQVQARLAALKQCDDERRRFRLIFKF